jgi:hypothetical protein
MGRDQAFLPDQLASFFSDANGYENLCNTGLADKLLRFNLSESDNYKNPAIISSFVRWSFSVSFLMMLNAWQWFLAGISLGRQSFVPTQIMHLYYYSIFSASRAFLAANLKGRYALKIEKNTANSKEIRERRNVWISLGGDQKPFVELENPSAGEHQFIATWFYTIFSTWANRNQYPDVNPLARNYRFHVDARNLFTYQIDYMADELYTGNPAPPAPSNEALLAIWQRDQTQTENFPEEFWALEHIRVITDLHLYLLETYKQEKPYTNAQSILLNSLQRHHAQTGLIDLLRIALGPMFAGINK